MKNIFKKIYLPGWEDWIFTLGGILFLFISSKGVVYETGFWSAFIFLVSIILTNISKNFNEKFNRDARKRRKHMRSHKGVSYPKYQITKIQYDLDINFKVLRFAIGYITSIILAILNNFVNYSYEFKYFAFSYFMNLFLIPLLLLLYFAFSYDCEYSEDAMVNSKLKVIEKTKFTIRNLLNSLYFDKNGKKGILKGTLGLIALIFFVIIAIAFKIISVV